MSELLSCPFCGASEYSVAKPDGGFRAWCAQCGAFGPKKPTIEEAIAAWRRRATDPVQQRAAVAGEYMQRSHADFERACEVAIGELQEQPNPPNHIIALLCDAVRVSRECCRQTQTNIMDPALERLKEAALASGLERSRVPSESSFERWEAVCDELESAADAYTESRKAKP